MKKDLKQKWVGALRSGAYKQGIHYLKSLTGDQDEVYEYCCLGVLLDVAEKKFKPCKEEVYDFTQECDGDIWELSDALLDEFLITEKEQNSLIRMNDSGVPFGKIANWIEENM